MTNDELKELKELKEIAKHLLKSKDGKYIIPGITPLFHSREVGYDGLPVPLKNSPENQHWTYSLGRPHRSVHECYVDREKAIKEIPNFIREKCSKCAIEAIDMQVSEKLLKCSRCNSYYCENCIAENKSHNCSKE
jgi:hypothetical protein